MELFHKNRQQEQGGSPVQKALRLAALHSRRNLAICVIFVAAFVVIRGVSGEKTFVPLLEETRFSIVALDGTTHSFVYAEADSIELFDDFRSFDRGVPVNAAETRRLISGTYRNAEFGEYQLHAVKKLNNYIVVRRPEGVLVFNLESDETTQALYASFTEDLN